MTSQRDLDIWENNSLEEIQIVITISTTAYNFISTAKSDREVRREKENILSQLSRHIEGGWTHDIEIKEIVKEKAQS